MSASTVRRTPRSGRQSLLFKDLASPVSTQKGKFSSPGQAAAISALWRENFGGSDLPPPPMYTLDDRLDFSPESGIGNVSSSPESKSELRTPCGGPGGGVFSTPPKGKSEASTSSGLLGSQLKKQGSASSSWWSSAKASDIEQNSKGKDPSVHHIVQSAALVTLPPPREVARPEMLSDGLPIKGLVEEQEWVTVYGFSPGDTNLVLREFEKCGAILKHVPGPREANWMHILYQNRSDAQKAFMKNGTVINGVLMVGVKPVDPMHQQALSERLNNQGLSPLPLSSTRTSESRPSSHLYHVWNGSPDARRPTGDLASPKNSLVSRFVDLMFGV